MNVIDQIEKAYTDKEIPKFGPGDTVRVHVKISEGNKFRIQVLKGSSLPSKIEESLCFHSPKGFSRVRRGARIPTLFSSDRADRTGTSRASSPSQAILLERAQRKSRPNQEIR